MADEFSEELAEGVAYVAGHDDDARPVVVRASRTSAHRVGPSFLD